MRLILHAGTHKTGTSTIQRVLHEHRDALRSQGLVYPDPAPWFGSSYLGHHPLVHAVASQDAAALGAARDFLRGVAGDTSSNETVLLSAEPVYRHVLRSLDAGWWRRHHAYLRELSRELAEAGFDVEAVLVFRRRDAFIESVYHERVANGFGRPFTNLLDNAGRLLDYDRQLGLFRNAFPRVSTHRYEDLAGPELVPSFLRAIGVEPPAMDVKGWDRQSTDARVTLWMAARHRENADEDLVGQRRRFAKNPVCKDLFADFGRVTLWSDPSRRRELLDRYGDHDAVTDPRPAAVLTPDIETRIDKAFDKYLRGKRLKATRRSARRPA